MPDMKSAIQEKLPLTVSEMVAVAQEYGARVVDVVLVETELRTGKSREEYVTGDHGRIRPQPQGGGDRRQGRREHPVGHGGLPAGRAGGSKSL